jgi:hypothetical protein
MEKEFGIFTTVVSCIEICLTQILKGMECRINTKSRRDQLLVAWLAAGLASWPCRLQLASGKKPLSSLSLTHSSL